MKYEGKIYAKVAGKYIALVETAQDIDALKAENKRLREVISDLLDSVRGEYISGVQFIHAQKEAEKALNP